MPESENPYTPDTSSILRREAERIQARYVSSSMPSSFNPLRPPVWWSPPDGGYTDIRPAEPSPAAPPLNPVPPNPHYTNISWDEICDEYLSRHPPSRPAARNTPPIQTPDFPPGTRYFIWTDSEYGNPTSNLQVVFTPFEGKTFRQGFHEAGRREFSDPEYMNARLRERSPQWAEVTLAGFQIMMAGIRGEPRQLPELQEHFIHNPAPIVLRPRPTNHKIGVPKGRLP